MERRVGKSRPLISRAVGKGGVGLERAGSCKPRIGIPPLPHPSPAGNKANGSPKRGEKKLNRKAEPECKGRSALFPGGEFIGLGARAGDEQGAPRRGAASAKKPSMKPCSLINAAGRPFLSSDPSRGPPDSRHPRATQTGAGGDRAKPAQTVASLRARKTGNRQRLASPRN